MKFQQFVKKYEKNLLIPAEYLKRQIIFYQNIEKLKKLRQQGCQSCGVTKFYDQSQDQFRSRMGLVYQQKRFDQHLERLNSNNTNAIIIQNQTNLINQYKDHLLVSSTPENKNWADEKKITSIKNQGKCGTCWSFATTAAIESSMIIKGKFFNFLTYQPDLSEQFLLNCANFGSCSGGYLEQSIDLAFNKGVPYQIDLPYMGYKGDKSKCNDISNNIFYSKNQVSRYSYYNVSDDKLIQILLQGPVMISISSQNWQNYAGGIFKCSSTSKVDHAVLLVGYDSTKWIVKNQWGQNWGQKGYIWVTRNRTNNCKIGSSVHQLSEFTLDFNKILILILVAITYNLFL